MRWGGKSSKEKVVVGHCLYRILTFVYFKHTGTVMPKLFLLRRPKCKNTLFSPKCLFDQNQKELLRINYVTHKKHMSIYSMKHLFNYVDDKVIEFVLDRQFICPINQRRVSSQCSSPITHREISVSS